MKNEEVTLLIPIVVSGYNRPESLSRVLRGLSAASYPIGNIPLWISLDAGGPNGTRQVAEEFDWQNGTKSVLAREQHLGMRQHAFACMELFGTSQSLIFLEDDSYVGPQFYRYALNVSSLLTNNDAVFAASLFCFDLCEFDGLRFSPTPTEEDVFFVRSATTWGIVLDRDKWTQFRQWFDAYSSSNEGAKYIPSQVNEWPATSWKKYVNRYISSSESYFVYPAVSHLTHFADPGTHFATSSGNFQVPFVRRYDKSSHKTLSMNIKNIAKYDEFWELLPPEELKNEFSVDFEFDLRRIKRADQFRSKFVVTTRPTRKPLMTFGRDFFPIELNVLERRSGSGLALSSVDDISEWHIPMSPRELRSYMKDIGARNEISMAIDRVLRKLKLRN